MFIKDLYNESNIFDELELCVIFFYWCFTETLPEIKLATPEENEKARTQHHFNSASFPLMILAMLISFIYNFTFIIELFNM